MIYRVHIENAWASFSHRVWLLQERSDGLFLVQPNGDRLAIVPGAAPPPDAFFCEIPHEAANAFLAELSRLLGAVEHPEQLRKDYEAERARVDRLIGIVAEYRA